MLWDFQPELQLFVCDIGVFSTKHGGNEKCRCQGGAGVVQDMAGQG